MVLKGRLGLDSARIPQADRHGLMWLGRGKLYVHDGTLRFATPGGSRLAPGDYGIPFQMLNCMLLEPGVTVSHDALRILARHGTGLVVVAEGAVRFYASMPFGPDRSQRARKQALAWADADGRRVQIARKMYAWRLGEFLPSTDLNVLRGMEGVRVKETYSRLAEQYGIEWRGRRYDRSKPKEGDIPNRALNHAATAVYGAAGVAVAVTGSIPQLGFIHEDSGISFCLDIADLFRESVTVPAAFAAARAVIQDKESNLERRVRQIVGQTIQRKKVIGGMIDRIKDVIDGDDRDRDAQRA